MASLATSSYAKITVTKSIRAYHLKLNSVHIALVDTPGFDDTYITDAEVFKDLAIWLAAQYQTQAQVTAILYMQPITAMRMRGSALLNLTTMKKMLGVQSFPHLILVTSMWDLIDPATAENREKELTKSFWHDLISEGARVARSYGDRASVLHVLETINVQGKDLTLTIQQELVDENLPLGRTSAGTFLGHEFRRQADIHNERLRQGHTESRPAILQEPTLDDGSQSVTGNLAGFQKNLRELQVLDSSTITDAASLWLAKDAAQLQGLIDVPAGSKGDTKASNIPTTDYSSIFLAGDTMRPNDSQQSIYESLSGDDFRLVHLRAGQGPVPVELSLIVANLKHPPQYAALSYVVGQNNTSVTVNFRRDYHVFPIVISDALETALRCLRRPYTDILLWVDALSINQFDLQERAREIRRMSQLFRSASNVCIWLGPASPEVIHALDFIPQVLNFAHLEELVRDVGNKQKWLELTKLMSRPYFRRRFVVQEILLSRNATVHCGDRAIPWHDFVDVAVLLRSKWSELQQHLALTHEDNLELGDAQLLGAASLIEVSRLIFRKDTQGNILQRLLDLETLLSLLPTFEVTELLDTVYAIIDLAKDGLGSQTLRVDYGLQPEELFQDVTKLVIESSNSLDIICRPWAPKCGVPSWIPTITKYTFRRRAANFQYDRQQGVSLVGMPQSRPYRACGETTPQAHVSFRIEGIQRILTASGIRLGAVGELGQRSMNGSLPREWLDIGGWKDIKDPVPGPFWRTLVADRSSEGKAVPEWYERACQFAFRQSTRDDIDTSSLLKTLKSTHVHEFLNRVQEVVWGRTLAAIDVKDEDRVCLGLCPPDTKWDDVIAILYGCSVPVVLRKVRSYFKLIGECFVYGMMDGEAFIGGTGSATEAFALI
ncbi:hypothetical protein A1O7_06360 [Cladophialophora yegresii CBS 114405]|uniref:Heterokaryon incompatibility domain-containing protein n=1 Tax=Cladophialophora yegresii CBS 114405 TaxID=1182544 RepID=W9WKE5_9EURO|nr:uncharacterized protein A1O7_06360 [Cladophialophora yegresii CBS 114405]EXJ58929.1 hypothetical protein A1O7_06360 [Cladophialophora yegresii CBS 114405]